MTNPGWLPTWQADDYEIQKENLVYGGVFRVKQLILRHRLFSGAWGAWVVREFIERQDAAAAILYDPVQDKVVMVEQFRVGLLGKQNRQSPWMLEIVAGLVEEGESAESTILREAFEEADCEIQSLIRIGNFYNTPGGFSEKTTVFCGIVSVDGVAGIHGVATEEEDILVHVLSPDAIDQALDEGQLVTSASTLVALQWLRRQRAGKIDIASLALSE